ncbi:MAG TPA: hypothetical protein EYG73_06855, partial [Arcobacter sp.]|nr:hypothetical protein [Arcobacter sp.]
PFVTMKAKNEKNEDIIVIGIDDNKNYLCKDKGINLFEKNELSETFEEKLQNTKKLESQRILSKEIIKELEKYDLLQDQSFNLRINGEIKPIIDGYFIVNRTKLNNLDDKIIALWTKKGWMGIIDAHIYSLRNFQKLVELIK